MNPIEVYKIGLEQREQLQEIGKQTFFETFAESNTQENIQQYLRESFAVEKLTSELTNPNSEFYFAESNKQVIGYLKINLGEAQTELRDSTTLEIERIYVLSEFHGKHIGQLLYDKAIQIAKQRKVNSIWLGVWEKNVRAIGFYTKNGFAEFDKHFFKLGNEKQTDILMQLKLNRTEC